jgi:hypothetical protein
MFRVPRKKFFIGMFVLLLALILGETYILYSRSKVYIDPTELAQFSRVVPIDQASCIQQDAIEYYFYEDLPETGSRNNKFGLYVYPDNEKFLELANNMVNSSSGDWGYVLLPYNVRDTDRRKWERVFYLLNKWHLIPVVQLWNVDPLDYENQTNDAAAFMNSFAWPIKQRYISAYNEPNDANFWYGRVDAAEYARILDYTIDTFKSANEDFFMMNGALNSSAATTYTSLDALEYMRLMDLEVDGIFEKLDGWASHSYPQPNFSGSPYDEGRWSIKAYAEELGFLESFFGVTDLPVFITETGWAHDVGRDFDNSYLPISTVAEYMRIAYEQVWLPDDRVMAVMPFTIWYESPVDHFAWIDSRWIPYEQYQEVKSMEKIAGNPAKLSVSEISSLGCSD